MNIRRTTIDAKAAIPLTVWLACLSFGATAANANGFLDNFDSVKPLSLQNDPQVNYASVSPYFKYGSAGNGVITNCVGAGCDLTHGNPVTSDASGSGKFLFENTAYNGPKGQNVFYVSKSFSVTPYTNYTFSFATANATTCCYAVVDSSIRGNHHSPEADFAPVTVDGPSVNMNHYTKWIVSSYTWNSGASDLATITLSDSNLAGYGNDFGVDDISVALPEPATWAIFLVGFGATGAALRWRRRTVLAAA